MNVVDLFAKLGVRPDIGSFKDADKRIQGLQDGLGKLVHGFAGLFAVHQFAEFVHELVQTGDALDKASIRIGITTEALQELNFAAGLAGASSSDLETSLRFIAKNAYEAANGGKEATAAFAELGIEVADGNGGVRKADDLLGEVAERMSKVTDTTQRTALAVKLLGRGGAALIPLLSEGAEGLAKARKEAQELGGGFDEQLIENAKELEDDMSRLSFATEALKSRLGNGLLPVVDRVVRAMIHWNVAIQQSLKANRFIQIALALGTAALVAWGVAAIWAARATVVAWARAAAPFIVMAAVLLAIAAALDDVHALLSGGKSLIGKYLDEWLGIGTTDQLVRKWRDGFEILSDSIVNFGDNVRGVAKNTLEIVGMLGDAVKEAFSGDLSEAATIANKALDRMAGAVADVAEPFVILANEHRNGGGDARSERQIVEGVQVWGGNGEAPRAGRGLGADVLLDPSIPRAERGLGGELNKGSAGFGQAAMGAVSRLFKPSAVSGAHAVMGHGEAAGARGPQAPDSGAGHVTIEDHSTHKTEINAHTNMTPQELERVADKVAAAREARQARNVRAALGKRGR